MAEVLDNETSCEQIAWVVSEAFGFSSPFTEAERLSGGIENLVWLVRHHTSEFVLRVHPRNRAPHIEFEGQLLEALGGTAHEIEVPVLLRSGDGKFGVQGPDGSIASLQLYISSSGSAQPDLSLMNLASLVRACEAVHALGRSLSLPCPSLLKWDTRLIEVAERGNLDPALEPVVWMALDEMALQGASLGQKLVLSHGDVTPNNVLVDASGNPSALVDFDDAGWCTELFDAAVMARSFAFGLDGRVNMYRLHSIWGLWHDLNARYGFDAFWSTLKYVCLRMSLLVADAIGAGAQGWTTLEDTRRWRALTEMDVK
ncbi:phosphotransferase enzyme family protein [Leifsonia aquatica]|uniref:phosphotransferase enzyme family protein n=1 Tax=Leifsonia aquatica TaxID=144185 RepID=UPI00384AB0EF